MRRASSGRARHLLADEEERGDRAALRELLEHRRRALLVRAVVEGQGHAALVLEPARDAAGGRQRPEDGRGCRHEPRGRRRRPHVISASTSDAADGSAAKERSTA